MVNSIEFVTAYLAVLRAGLVAVPIDPGATTSEVAQVLADSGSRLCFADATTVATVRKAVRNSAAGRSPGRAGSLSGALRPALIVAGAPTSSDERGYGDVAAAGNEVVSPRDPEALAALLYSRGSNGRLGAAMLSHRALLTNIDQTSRTRPAPMSPADVVLGALPLSCVWGLGVVLGQVLLQGSTLVLGQRLEPTEMLQLIAAEQVTCVLVSAPMIASWARREDLAEKLASVRTLLSAAPLPAQVARAFEDRSGIPVERGYGLTEAAPLVASTVGVPDRKLGSSGRALPGVELQVVDEERRVVQADEPGEIEVRGRNMFSGYWPDGNGSPPPEGWLATRDIGFLDADGDLFLLDRLDEVVIASGFHVYPSKIEDVISQVEGVDECAVIGTPHPVTGEAVVAYVVGAAGVDVAMLRADVRRHCDQHLAGFMVPSRVDVVTGLPRSATGKVDKWRLRRERGPT